jgi:hypothetical protein
MPLIAKIAFAVAALIGSVSALPSLGSAARANEASVSFVQFRAQGVACAGGYHLDGNGDCQPDGGQASLQPCPPGQMAQPYPSGSSYRCVEIPASYRQYFR